VTPEFKSLVRRALDNALENDNGEILEWTPNQLYDDLIACTDFEDYGVDPEEIIQVVAEWLQERNDYMMGDA